MSNERPEMTEANPQPADPAGSGDSPAAAATPPVADNPPPTLSPAELDALRTKAGQADEHWDKYLRTVADFENFKKRAARERQEAMRIANESLLGKLIGVLDNFDAALAAAGDAAGTNESFRTGVTMISSQLRGVLTEAGLEEINAAGQPFNPNVHEAVAQHESADVPEGHVLQQLRKGYKFRERLLRPATVIVAKAAVPTA